MAGGPIKDAVPDRTREGQGGSMRGKRYLVLIDGELQSPVKMTRRLADKLAEMGERNGHDVRVVGGKEEKRTPRRM
jgi:hypothetical protein